ncbi:MAG: purine-binding chemotaxis protein CheW [Chthoniobacter sp.]|jgi:purine-binding chemotaxis protein CheW|nr:purine-binding chemotaxis protein CheW [Chthoniobacter sp.]
MSNETARIDWAAAKRSLQEADTALEKALVADEARIDQVYRDRAIQMAKRHAETATDVRTIRVLVFALGAETYGIAIADLAEVLPATRCTPVPRAAAEVAGVINLRGELRSVIDLRRLLSVPPAADESGSCILMLRNGRDEVGLKVGPVEKVQTIREEELATPESGGTEGSSSYVKGLSPDKIIVLSPAALRLHPVFRNSR